MMLRSTILLLFSVLLVGCNLSNTTLLVITNTPSSETGVVLSVQTPTPTLSETPTFSPVKTSQIPCTPRQDWVAYRVLHDDTLYSIAERTQSTVMELAIANCLGNTTLIYAGDLLRVPRIPSTRIPQLNDPRITNFATTTTAINATDLQQRKARIPVTWNVTGRDERMNLAFEQLMPDGSIINVELQRDNPIIPSSGSGAVAPVPVGGAKQIILQMRVFTLSQQETLATKKLSVQIISNSETPLVNCTVQNQMAQGVTDSPTQSGIHLGELGPLTSLPALARSADGKFVKIPYADSTGWLFVSDNLSFNGNCSAIPIEVGAVQKVQIVKFSAVPNPVARGAAVTVSWDTLGAERTEIRVLFFDTKTQHWGRPSAATATNLPLNGSWTFTMPTTAYYGVRFDLDAIDAQGNVATARSDEVMPLNYPCFWDEKVTCASTQTNFTGSLQEFEHGYLLWQQDTKVIYVVTVGWYTVRDNWLEGDINTITDTPPEGLLAPQDRFAKLWSSNAEVRQSLGWAKSAQEDVSSLLQQEIQYDSSFNGFYIRWPDGRLVKFIGMIGDTQGPYVSIGLAS
jgi:hypothetical protein